MNIKRIFFEKLAVGMKRIRSSVELFFMMLRLNRSVNLVNNLFKGLKCSSLSNTLTECMVEKFF
eukprot:snap_masked-scaffold_22-processed-gene-2.4-mRNA-1 protein AED:1.00 eAED:1.00 QI:0/0/0/0/1/1/3/0/63